MKIYISKKNKEKSLIEFSEQKKCFVQSRNADDPIGKITKYLNNQSTEFELNKI